MIDALLSGSLIGLANAAHCAGMCGAFAVRAGATGRTGLPLYLAGKALTYTFIGALAGLLGHGILAEAGAAQAGIGIAVACVMFAAGLRLALPRVIPLPGGFAISRFLKPAIDLLRTATAAGGAFAVGAVTAAIPCGAVYIAGLKAASTGAVDEAMLVMLGFAIGTGPVLMVVGLAGGRLGARLSARALRWIGAALLCGVGALTFARAMAPLLHPEHPCCH